MFKENRINLITLDKLDSKYEDNINFIKDKVNQYNLLLDKVKTTNRSYLFVVVGGDGTYSKTIKDVVSYFDKNKKLDLLINTYFVFINGGRLGFHSCMELEDKSSLNYLDYVLDKYVTSNNLTLDKKEFVLEYPIFKINDDLFINELSLFTSKVIRYDLVLDNTLFNDIYSSGFIVSTPFGSSGLNYSFKNPVIISNSSKLVLFSNLALIKSSFHNSSVPDMILDFNNISKFEIKFHQVSNSYYSLDGNKDILLKDDSCLKLKYLSSVNVIINNKSKYAKIKKLK